MATEASTRSLKTAFEGWAKALNTGDLDTFWAWFDKNCEVLDEDYPWRMNRAEFIDHIGFHSRDLWEFFEWIPREVKIQVRGTTGHVSGFSTFRGKPRDAGFRQRHMGFTITWFHDSSGWHLLSWHQSPLAGRILGASPG